VRKVEPTAQHACRKTTFEHKAGPQLPHAAGVTTGQPPPRTMAPLAGWPNRNTWTRRISAPAAAATAVDQMDAAQQQVLHQKCGDRGSGRSSAAHTLCPPTGGGVTHQSGAARAIERLPAKSDVGGWADRGRLAVLSETPVRRVNPSRPRWTALNRLRTGAPRVVQDVRGGDRGPTSADPESCPMAGCRSVEHLRGQALVCHVRPRWGRRSARPSSR